MAYVYPDPQQHQNPKTTVQHYSWQKVKEKNHGNKIEFPHDKRCANIYSYGDYLFAISITTN